MFWCHSVQAREVVCKSFHRTLCMHRNTLSTTWWSWFTNMSHTGVSGWDQHILVHGSSEGGACGQDFLWKGEFTANIEFGTSPWELLLFGSMSSYVCTYVHTFKCTCNWCVYAHVFNISHISALCQYSTCTCVLLLTYSQFQKTSSL